MTRSSTESKTSLAIVANLSELELKKILIEKMESKKEFDIGATDEQSDKETSYHTDWFQKPAKIPTPDHDWNKTLPAVHGPVQPYRTYATSAYKDQGLQNMVISNGLKIWSPTQSGVKYRSTMTSMHYGESIIKDANNNNSIDLLLIGNLLVMSTPNVESLLSQSFKLLNGTATNIWIGSLFVEDDDKYYTSQGRRLQKASPSDIEDHADYFLFKALLVEDLQLGVGMPIQLFQSYGFILLGTMDKKNKLMVLMKIYKFSDDVLDNEKLAEFDESNTHVLEVSILQVKSWSRRFFRLNLPDHRRSSWILKDGGEVKEFQRSFCHSDTERLSRSDEVLKLKNFKKDAPLNLFKSSNQERYEHVSSEVTSSQGGIVHKMAKRDYAWLMISRCSRSHSRQAKEQAQDLKFMITTSNHKLMIEVKDYEHKTKVKA
ncbi:hypothetical protein Tco_0923982 [Tanacetum coccineum]|uniref:Uncharacterized protein n=1 Tax=Tanacetum coccineum TaxID=301880 RepID=A0ABQ5D3M1_9ASTR